MAARWSHDGTGWKTLAPAGFPDEATLHTLVEQAPHLLPLAGAPRLHIVGREVALGSGYADLIAIEPSGRLAVIEIKLARNAEAKRAVVAQVLAYAAFLRGKDVSTLEQSILASHLTKRQYTSLAHAVSTHDQEGSFDPETFASGLAESLAEGKFRLVIVLDAVSSDLARLVSYLEAMTSGLLIDLVTVSAYSVNGSQVLVPQRIEGEHVASAPSAQSKLPSSPTGAETQTTTTMKSQKSQGFATEGAEDFVAAIEQAPEAQRPMLQKLADWAIALERQGLVKLWTYHGVNGRLTLLPYLIVDNSGLVTIYSDKGKAGVYLQFWRTVFERRAPQSIPVVEAAIGKSIGQGNTTGAISDELLRALTEAYQQAGNTIPSSSEG